MTRLACALDAGAGRLRAAALESPRLEARLLLEWATGLDTARLISNPQMVLSRDVLGRFEQAIEERSAGCPVARIVGKKEFWGLTFQLNAETLVPRPETETVVETALARVGRPWQNWRGSICDLGTGSGAILIAFLKELPLARGIGVDVSAGAIDGARRNAERHGVGERIEWLVGDFALVPDARSDIVVCNPPYIAEAEFAGLSREVRDFDPHRALNGGSDGLDAYRVLAGRLADILVDNGLAALELGAGQRDDVASLMIDGGLEVETTIPDLAGIPRVLLCRKP